MSNHLGNVLEVVTDRKLPVPDDNGNIDYLLADVVSYSDYYPYGMQMPGEKRLRELDGNGHIQYVSAKGSAGDYRYGFNGMEGDPEVKGQGNSYTTEFRQYDPRIGRWLSIDPLFKNFPWQSPYVAYDNNPIYYVDPKGLAAEGNGDDEKEKSEPKNDKISKRELKRATRYARNQNDRTKIYEYEKDGRVRYGVKTYHSESSVDENGDVTVIGSMKDVKFNRVANWWSSVFHRKGIIVWGDGHGGNDTYGGNLKDFDNIETIELSEINDLINAGKGKSTTRPKLNKSQATERSKVYDRVGEAMEEDAKRSGTVGNGNKNKPALKKSDAKTIIQDPGGSYMHQNGNWYRRKEVIKDSTYFPIESNKVPDDIKNKLK